MSSSGLVIVFPFGLFMRTMTHRGQVSTVVLIWPLGEVGSHLGDRNSRPAWLVLKATPPRARLPLQLVTQGLRACTLQDMCS